MGSIFLTVVFSMLIMNPPLADFALDQSEEQDDDEEEDHGTGSRILQGVGLGHLVVNVVGHRQHRAGAGLGIEKIRSRRGRPRWYIP